MTVKVLSVGTLGLAGLVSAGLMALPIASHATDAGSDTVSKRDDDAPEMVLVVDDDDDDTNDQVGPTRTRTRTGGGGEGTQTRTRGGDTGTRDDTGTGTRTGRDHSRQRQVDDVTRDGDRGRDHSANHTNDRSRHNTRG